MTAFLLMVAIFVWMLVGLRIFTWIINRMEKMFSLNGVQEEVCFCDWFRIPQNGDGFFVAIAVILSLAWPLILIVVIEAWREQARKMARYE